MDKISIKLIQQINHLINENITLNIIDAKTTTNIVEAEKKKIKDYEFIRYRLIVINLYNVGKALALGIKPMATNLVNLAKYLEYAFEKSEYKQIIKTYNQLNKHGKIKINMDIIKNYIYKLSVICNQLFQHNLYTKINKQQLDDLFMRTIFFYSLYMIGISSRPFMSNKEM